jgi:hypothetical protein
MYTRGMSEPLLNDDVVTSKVEKTGVGPIVSTVVVVILIVIGGIYFFISQAAKLHQTPVENVGANS